MARECELTKYLLNERWEKGRGKNMAHLRTNWLVEKGREGVFLDAVGELAGGQMVKYLTRVL